MVGKVFKIMAFSLFGVAFALTGGAIIAIYANSEVGGWLLLSAGIAVVIAAICAVVAIMLGKGSTAEKAGKFILLSSPFVLLFVIIGAVILLGGVFLYCWLVIFSNVFI